MVNSERNIYLEVGILVCAELIQHLTVLKFTIHTYTSSIR